MEAETEVTHPQAKEHQELLEAKRSMEHTLLQSSRRNQTCQHLDFEILASRAIKK